MSQIRWLLSMGRKKRWSEDMQARFPDGTFGRITAVLAPEEDRTDFVRAAVENELRRRETPRKSAKKTDAKTLRTKA